MTDKPIWKRQHEPHCKTCRCYQHEPQSEFEERFREISRDLREKSKLPGHCKHCGSKTPAPDRVCIVCAVY